MEMWNLDDTLMKINCTALAIATALSFMPSNAFAQDGTSYLERIEFQADH